MVKNEIQKLDVGSELLAQTLVDQDLLVPDLAFLESLLPDQEEDHVEVGTPPPPPKKRHIFFIMRRSSCNWKFNFPIASHVYLLVEWPVGLSLFLI